MVKLVINEAFLAEVESLETLLKNNVAGMFGGNHKSKTFGSSCEFADYREYAPGDDVNRIDWNVYARSDKLYEKLYLDERQMHTRIYVDASRSMEYGTPEKAEQALKLAAALAYLSVSEMDKVSVYAIQGNECTEIIGGIVGKDAYFGCIDKMNGIDFKGEVSIGEAIAKSKLGMGDGYSILISDFLTDENYEDAIDAFADKKRDIFCIQVLSREELNPQIRGKKHLIDAENANNVFRKKIDRDRINAYKSALKAVTERIRSYCQTRGGQYMLVPAHEDVATVFFGNMTELGVLK